jgi:hypothetical protein
VYSIIYYGIRSCIQASKTEARTDKETPYIPVPKEGIKLSSGH